MNIRSSVRLMLTLACVSPAFATVVVSSPSNGSTVGTSVTFAASGTTSTCSKGVSAMGVYIDNSLKYTVNGTKLSKSLQVSAGKHAASITEWDFCGGSTTAPITFTASGAQSASSKGVIVSSPAAGDTVSSPASFNATATTSCSKGVSAIGIYINGNLAYKVNGSKLSTSLSLGSGAQKAVVQEWDGCGGASNTTVAFTIGSSSSVGKKLTSIQAVHNWNQWGELPPVYDICTSCKGIAWSMIQHYKAVSLSGNATKFSISGTRPYADVLWSNKLLGQGTTLNMPDSNHAIIPHVYHMQFDADILLTNLAVTQDLELDVNLYFNSIGLEWGTQCNHLNGNVWDIWNVGTRHWNHTSIPCTLTQGKWNHVSFLCQRESNNNVTYKSITVNGKTWPMNITTRPYKIPSNWYGMTVNYQMDGDNKMHSNTTYLDNLTVAYW